ncbi:MAG TPA: DNA polymerase domain-containing protein [Nitrososphaerales archaeon]|nr:DNA polymerase domain-containing protein [Nitrososphaerales archaeon]
MESSLESFTLAGRLSELTRPVSEMGEALLASATYDGDLRVAVLKFYDEKAGRCWVWRDNTGHKPYCYTRLGADEIASLRTRRDVLDIVEVEKMDLLEDKRVPVRKIITTDPLAIGGGQDSIRDKIKAWEADIKYYENYAYDRRLRMGTYYRVSGGSVEPVVHEVPESVTRSLEEVFKKNPPEFGPYLKEWADLLGQPLPNFKRIAMDIEVANESGRLPDVEDPRLPIIAVSFFNDKERVVYALRKRGTEPPAEADASYTLKLFDDEAQLIRAAYSKMVEYPVLLTFNGDDFDLRYLRHRAERFLHIPEEEDPIQLQRQEASLKHGIHIDLYRFFNIKSVQVYAFSNRYSEHTLNGISEALLNKSKIEFEGEVGDLPLSELARYCLNDSQLTYELTTMSDSVVMKLLVVVSRIAKMPMNDASRLGVSNWIRSMLFYEHRKIDALIPRTDELSSKGEASSQAIIKGKKYKGGLVIEPKPGVFFDVAVLDFASLYPSLIKVDNLSYETVNCKHEECKTNVIPETRHWVCRKRKGIESLVIGSLRDLRVNHYKQLAKDPKLSKDERELYGVVSQGLKVILNACFTGDTFIVTADGIKNIREMRVGDRVVNINPETRRIEIDRVVEVQSFPFDGELLHFKDSRMLDLLVTPNHRFLVEDKRVGSKTGARFVSAEEVYGRTNMRIPKATDGVDLNGTGRVSFLEKAKELQSLARLYPPAGVRMSTWFRKLPVPLGRTIRAQGTVVKRKDSQTGKYSPHYRLPAKSISESDIDAVEDLGGTVKLGDLKGATIYSRMSAVHLATLCGWYVSEGNTHVTKERFYSGGGHRGNVWTVQITQSQGCGNLMGLRYREEIRQVLRDLGLSFTTDRSDSKHFTVSGHVMTEWMLSNCYTAGSRPNSWAKRIPDFVFESRDTMEAFLDSVYKGDGTRGKRTYSTVSVRLAEDMVRLLSFLGFKTKIEYNEKDRFYRVVFRNSSVKLTHSGPRIRESISKVPYVGSVYCVTTEKNHTVIAGRNGRFVHVGQSYGSFGFETFAFYCLPVAEATAALGRYAITRTIERCNASAINVLYSDSVTRDRCVTVRDPTGSVKVLPVESLFESFAAYDTRADGKQVVRPSGWKTLATDTRTGKTDWKDLAAIVRHRTSKRVYRVWDKRGSTTVTEDHSLVVMKNGNIELSRPQDLADKHLLRVDSIPRAGEVKALDLYELIKSITYRRRFKGSWRTLQAHCDDESVWFSWSNRVKPVKLKRIIKVGTPEFKALVELLGAYIPEGSSSTPDTTTSKVGASIACSDTQWLEKQLENYNSLFSNARVSIVRSYPGTRNLEYRSASGALVQVQYEDKTCKLQMMNGISAVFFKALCGQRSDGKHLPEFIFNSPDDSKISMIENMVKGDGSRVFGPAYSQEYRTKNFRYESKSNQLISGLSTLLLQLNINHSISYRPNKRTYTIATCTSMNVTRRSPRVVKENYDGFVYDLSVDGYHTFCDSCGSIVLKNTDSLFLQSPSKEQINEMGRWAESELGVELDLDKVYRYIAFSSRKKNYFGVLPDGTADIKGMTGKKSNSPEFLKQTFYGVLDSLSRVQSPADFERARASIRDQLSAMVSKLRGKQVPMADLAFNVMMSKPTARYDGTKPQHVRAAEILEVSGKEIKAGDIIGYVKTKSPPFVKPVNLAKPDDVDVGKYLEYAQSMFDQILDALDFSFDELMGATTLDSFWSS